MPFYHKLGQIPHKRHTVFRQPDGSIYHEQLFGTIGFDGMSALLYHVQPPTVVKSIYLELAAPSESMKDYFYKNADADEIIFIHKGSGKLRTQMGNIEFAYGDYLVIPRGMIYQLEFNDANNRLFIIQSFHRGRRLLDSH